nr:FGGY family carbohydrate kinase [uncultured Carboxylicivirga sp.]
MSVPVIAVFDIGKTNKKILLFDEKLQMVFQKEQKMPTIVDEDGFECDDIDLIENWMKSTLKQLVDEKEYDVRAVNFSTYGASLAFLDEAGKRLTPIYNYLKPIDESIHQALYEKYGGEAEFCRQTASPALGVMLNSGIQILWLQKEQPELFAKVKDILHFPQYLSYLLTGKVTSESTSIGCHTFMWNFDDSKYHQWLTDAGVKLPDPVSNQLCFDSKLDGVEIKTGIGVHDSSSSLVPYFKGSVEKFVLVSTGTWCINMNPYNYSPLTADQLKRDCLCYISSEQKPVKSSRLFMGHIHDVNTERLTNFFKVENNQYKKVKANEALMNQYLSKGKERMFFKDEMPADYIDASVDLSRFSSFDEAYHRLMYDLTLLDAESLDLVMSDDVKTIYISGGFARNEMFIRLMANFYPQCKVYTSEVDNASALGAALLVYDQLDSKEKPSVDLGLKYWEAFG